MIDGRPSLLYFAWGPACLLGVACPALSRDSRLPLPAAELGAEHVSVIARNSQKAFHLEQVGQRAGVNVSVTPLSQIEDVSPVDLAISTLPGDIEQSLHLLSRTPHAALLDVAYSPWPSRRGTEWASSGGEIISGLRMLAHQALIQVRIFVHGNPFEKLPNEESVKRAMFESVSL